MKSPPAFVILLTLFLFLALAGMTLIDSSAATSSTPGSALVEQAAFEKRESAYRANNIGVALLEQRMRHRVRGAGVLRFQRIAALGDGAARDDITALDRLDIAILRRWLASQYRTGHARATLARRAAAVDPVESLRYE